MRKKYVTLIVLIFITILCVGCSKRTQQITYSNLLDNTTQMEIGQMLADNGIPPKDIDLFIKQVKDYNYLMKDMHTFKVGFITVEGSQVNYNMTYPVEAWVNAKRSYSDFNSRIIAYELYKDYIQCTVPKEVIQDVALLFDLSIMDNNPSANLEKKDREKFISLYESIPIGNVVEEQYGKAIQKAWKERGITFQEHLNISMMNAFVCNKESGELFVAHAGILIEDKGYLLYLEKYGTLYPYQATKFKNRKQVKSYLIDKLLKEYGESNKPFIIMENSDIK